MTNTQTQAAHFAILAADDALDGGESPRREPVIKRPRAGDDLRAHHARMAAIRTGAR